MAIKNLEKEISWLLKEKYNNKPTKQFNVDIKRIEKGEPLDYVIGFTEFGAPPGSCKIDLSKKPLIPRTETEFWVEKAIIEIKNNYCQPSAKITLSRNFSTNPNYKNRKTKLKILDIFAGSGCIGIAILKHVGKCLPAGQASRRQVKCDFAEKDKNLLKQIKINLRINKIQKNKYKVIQSDVFKNVRAKYDYIFANPPYIADYRKNPSSSRLLRAILRNRIQKSVLDFEPHKALFGGGDGLLYIRKFLSQAKNHLNPGGKIFMEFDSAQKKEIEKLIARQNFLREDLGGREKIAYQDYEFYKDQYGKWRFVVIR